MRIILASASPRRRELLSLLTPRFEVIVSDIEERITGTLPQEVVEELSYCKAKAVFEQTAGDVLVIGADTVVAYQEQILGKPENKDRAREMLSMLSGNTHRVYTGVSLFIRREGQESCKTFHEVTEVLFYPLQPSELEWYVNSGECEDKAGSYGIQGLGCRFVKGIKGDYSNVVGLPVARLYHELQNEKISDF